MDIPVTLLCVFLVYVAVKWLDQLVENLGSTNAGIYSVLKVPLALGIGIAVATGIATTDFAPAQHFFGMTLDQMNGPSQIVVGLTLGAGATGIDTLFKTSHWWGANPTDPPA